MRSTIVSKYKKDGLYDTVSSSYNYAKNRVKAKVLTIPRNAGAWGASKGIIGTNIFEKEWDLLIILDTCRVDALRHMSKEYSFVSKVNKIQSVGGQSAEWIANTFNNKYKNEISNTAYITSNPHAETVIENRLNESFSEGRLHREMIKRLNRYGNMDFVFSDEFGLYEPLYQFESDFEHLPPRHVTDRAIEIGRKSKYERMILHYMPPHAPYSINAKKEGREMKYKEKSPFNFIRKNNQRREEVYKLYLDMLRWVLDDVEVLLENIERDKVVITADHGEAFGEYGIYMHHPGSLHPQIRTVPWVETTAKDKKEYTPKFDPGTTAKRSVKETLDALGYL